MMLLHATSTDIFTFSALFCGFLLAFCALEWRRADIQSNSRVIALAHCLITSRLVERAMFVDLRHVTPAAVLSSFGDPVTSAQMLPLLFSLAYFTYDTFVCVRIKEPAYMLVHHLICALVLLVVIAMRTGGYEVLTCLWVSEMSGVFLDLRHWLPAGTTIATVNDAAFALTFFVCRAALLPVVLYFTLVSATTISFVKVTAVIFQLLNVVMVWEVAYAIYLHLNPKEKSQ